MATSADPALLVDTSVAVALVVADDEAHDRTAEVVGARTLGLAGRAWFETYSVLTRLPPPAHRRPDEVQRMMAHDSPFSRFLDVDATEALATRDARAMGIYRALEVDVEKLA